MDKVSRCIRFEYAQNTEEVENVPTQSGGSEGHVNVRHNLTWIFPALDA